AVSGAEDDRGAQVQRRVAGGQTGLVERQAARREGETPGQAHPPRLRRRQEGREVDAGCEPGGTRAAGTVVAGAAVHLDRSGGAFAQLGGERRGAGAPGADVAEARDDELQTASRCRRTQAALAPPKARLVDRARRAPGSGRGAPMTRSTP